MAQPAPIENWILINNIQGNPYKQAEYNYLLSMVMENNMLAHPWWECHILTSRMREGNSI